ncbi:glycosyl hydrolase family 18 protein [Azorhizobium doebereinerae]|uniref:glycosyl hydrolase family 18 protein n=1 Tax=Azorhizobium doebereinerae TaxID=281091 RepID=UPI0003F9D9E1|nr:glycosyl hydrolase family 18 protein [Azorhizobium doebereinerae]
MAGQRPFVAYHTSWSEIATAEPEETSLARLPGYYSHVALSFAKPDLSYAGDLDLKGTGLLYPYSGAVLKAAIVRLKARHPDTRVLVAVGGWGQFAWDRLDAPALARLVRDLGADGVDIDYETDAPGCVLAARRVTCPDDALAVRVVEQIRAVLPRPFVVTAAGWSVGAYGEGEFASAPPRSPWTGSMLAVLRAPVARELDLISIMSYDAGPSYRPEQAFRAYRSLYKGPLALGIQVEPGTSGGPRFTLGYTVRMLRAVLNDPQAGAMLYGLRLTPPGPPGPDNPDYRDLSVAVCVTLALPDCAQPVP